MVRGRTSAVFGGSLLLLISFAIFLDRTVSANPVGSPTSSAAVDSAPPRVYAVGIELRELDYEDACKPLAEAEWQFVHDPSDPYAAKQWKEAANNFARYRREESKITAEQLNGTISAESTWGYKLDVIEHPGDAALSDSDYNKLVTLVAANRALKATTRYNDGARNLTRQEVEALLAHNGKEGEKLKAWTFWHQQYAAQLKDYSSVLQLTQKAALENEKSDVRSYWEMLVGEADAYEHLKYQLDGLSELQQKLVNFARKRLAKKYGAAEMANDSLPAHLLGSLSGNDWTYLAFDVMPEPDVVFNLRKKFWEKKMMGKMLYKSASSLGKKFLGTAPLSDFWTESIFKDKCPTKLVNFCLKDKLRVSTCYEPSLSNYLTAHKNIAKVLLHQMSSKSPIIAESNRYSVLEEAVSEFFSILAASPAWLKHLGLLDKSMGEEEAKIASMTITALDVLPRLAYYVAADKWRLDALEKNETQDLKKLTSDWWSNRLQYEFVTSATNDLPTFLDDEHIVGNRPYLSKALGILLAFQMYDYVFKSTEIRQEPFDKSLFNSHIVHMAQRSSDNWKFLIRKYMDIETIQSGKISEYFEELEYFMESYDESAESYDFNARELELEKMESDYRKVANAPRPTTTTTTSTTTTTTTTSRPSGNGSGSDSGSESTSRPPMKAKTPTIKSMDSADDDKSAIKPLDTNYWDESERMLEDEQAASDEANRAQKAGASRAVWAVGAVLVATVVICIIAIVGRRRCSKTPKNRRYV
ncbi:angiotensin-converting enzyme-like isoform X2 [Trichogramma pretiosum]|nr:angiotensin-converting enzyme-like isoform X2 [Trichogramma pretiosum]